MGLLGTLVLGLAGSIVGGLIAVALTSKTIHDFTAAGLLGSVIGGVIILVVYRMIQPHGRLTGRRGARI
jgi:uncharacterized membrane protein YeaQ/YmgE (transglycosylase-associated protein family)